MLAPIIAIDQNRCSGCGNCLAACKFQLLSFVTRNWTKTSVPHDIERCTACGECARRCPIGAISVAERRRRPRTASIVRVAPAVAALES